MEKHIDGFFASEIVKHIFRALNDLGSPKKHGHHSIAVSLLSLAIPFPERYYGFQLDTKCKKLPKYPLGLKNAPRTQSCRYVFHNIIKHIDRFFTMGNRITQQPHLRDEIASIQLQIAAPTAISIAGSSCAIQGESIATRNTLKIETKNRISQMKFRSVLQQLLPSQPIFTRLKTLESLSILLSDSLLTASRHSD